MLIDLAQAPVYVISSARPGAAFDSDGVHAGFDAIMSGPKPFAIVWNTDGHPGPAAAQTAVRHFLRANHSAMRDDCVGQVTVAAKGAMRDLLARQAGYGELRNGAPEHVVGTLEAAMAWAQAQLAAGVDGRWGDRTPPTLDDMAPKTLGLNTELHAYVVDHGMPPDAVQAELIAETKRVAGMASAMQVSAEQGAFLTFLTGLLGVRRAIEIGTFTGYSALAIAKGLPDDGQLICCDVNEEWVDIGRKHWVKAGVSDRIEVRIGPASATLAALGPEESFDLAFIDADKDGYIGYYEKLVPRLSARGVIIIDNVMWGGSVAVPELADTDENLAAILDFNAHVKADDRVEAVMLPVGDGITLVRRI